MIYTPKGSSHAVARSSVNEGVATQKKCCAPSLSLSYPLSPSCYLREGGGGGPSQKKSALHNSGRAGSSGQARAAVKKWFGARWATFGFPVWRPCPAFCFDPRPHFYLASFRRPYHPHRFICWGWPPGQRFCCCFFWACGVPLPSPALFLGSVFVYHVGLAPFLFVFAVLIFSIH